MRNPRTYSNGSGGDLRAGGGVAVSKERRPLPFRRVRRVAVLATGLGLGLSCAASAAPIPFPGGLLDGGLRTYAINIAPDGTLSDLVLLHDYLLGTDSYPAVPLSFLA